MGKQSEAFNPRAEVWIQTNKSHWYIQIKSNYMAFCIFLLTTIFWISFSIFLYDVKKSHLYDVFQLQEKIKVNIA